MITKEDYGLMIEAFETNFVEKYNNKRKEILYQELMLLDLPELTLTLKNLLLKFNKSNLPVLQEIKKEAYKICPWVIDLEEEEGQKKAI